jgi:CRISPR-associated exonuclease Cas4
MQITATHINYLFICHRKLWLFINGITMEHASGIVAEGKLLHETSYPQRSEKYSELELGGSKIDFYDAKNKVIHEIKRGKSMEAAHEWQIKYYLYLLNEIGIVVATGILEYPMLRETKEISFSSDDYFQIKALMANIEALAQQENCPSKIKKIFCKTCSYFDFCWISEIDEI